MSRKNRLLSIGEIAKITGAHIKSLRYYERINVLKPAYVDPDSGYRYYSLNQTYVVELIKLAIEMDIPLKEMSRFIDRQEVLDFKAFAAYAREVAGGKIKTLEKGLKFIDFLEQKMTLQEYYPIGPIYTRHSDEKYFHVIPYGKSFANLDQSEVEKLFEDWPYYEEEEYEWPDYGFFCECGPDGIQRYAFIEVPQDKADENCKIIPAGQYYCCQSPDNQIEQAKEIFADYLADWPSFLAIEIEVFSGKFNINKPMNELRVIGL